MGKICFDSFRYSLLLAVFIVALPMLAVAEESRSSKANITPVQSTNSTTRSANNIILHMSRSSEAKFAERLELLKQQLLVDSGNYLNYQAIIDEIIKKQMAQSSLPVRKPDPLFLLINQNNGSLTPPFFHFR